MNALQRARRHPVRGRPDAAHRPAARRVGFDGCVVSDYFSVRQLEDYHRLASDARTAAAQALARRDRRRAAEHRLLRASRSSRRSRPGSSRPRTSTRRCGACCGRSSSSACSSSRSSTSRQPRTQRHATRIARSPAGRAKSLVLLRNDGIAAARAGRRRRRHRAERRRGARNLFGDYAYPAHVESLPDLLDERRRGRRLASRSRSSAASTLERPTARRAERARRAAASGSATACASRRGCERQRRRPRAASTQLSRSRATQTSPSSSSATRRASRPTARAARAATAPRSTSRASRRSSSAPSPRPERRSCSCSSPAGRTEARRCTSVRGGRCWRGFPGEEGADAIAETLAGEASPGRQAADLLSRGRRPDPGLLRAQDLRRPLALEGRLRRRSRRRRSTRSATA